MGVARKLLHLVRAECVTVPEVFLTKKTKRNLSTRGKLAGGGVFEGRDVPMDEARAFHKFGSLSRGVMRLGEKEKTEKPVPLLGGGVQDKLAQDAKNRKTV